MSSLGIAPWAGIGSAASGVRPFFDAVSPVASAYADPTQVAPALQSADRTEEVYNQLLESLIRYNGTGNPHRQRPAVGPVPILFYAPGSMANAAALLGGMMVASDTTMAVETTGGGAGGGSVGTSGGTSGAVGNSPLRRLVSILLLELLGKLFARRSTATADSTGAAGAVSGIAGYSATGNPVASAPATGSLINVVNSG